MGWLVWCIVGLAMNVEPTVWWMGTLCFLIGGLARS